MPASPQTAIATIDSDLVQQIAALVKVAPKAPKAVTGTTKFTAEVLTRIFAALRTGHTVSDACLYAGVATSTYDDWLTRGRKHEEPYAQFCAVLDRLNVAAYSHAVECFSSHAGKDPKIAERFLARRAKKEWGVQGETDSSRISIQIGTFLLEGSPSED